MLQYTWGDIVYTAKSDTHKKKGEPNMELGMVLYRVGTQGEYAVHGYDRERVVVRKPVRMAQTLDGVPRDHKVVRGKEKQTRDNERAKNPVKELIMGTDEYANDITLHEYEDKKTHIGGEDPQYDILSSSQIEELQE